MIACGRFAFGEVADFVGFYVCQTATSALEARFLLALSSRGVDSRRQSACEWLDHSDTGAADPFGKGQGGSGGNEGRKTRRRLSDVKQTTRVDHNYCG